MERLGPTSQKGEEKQRPWGAVLIKSIKELYPGVKQPVLYRSDSLLRQFVSPETLNNIFTLARWARVLPLPYHQGPKTFYLRDEIVTAISWCEQFCEERGIGLRVAKQLRRASRVSEHLTLRETAQKLDIPAVVFQRLVTTGELSLGNDILDESVRRLSHSQISRKKLIDPDLLEQELVKETVEKWRNRYANLDSLTPGIFYRHRELFATVSGVAIVAGLHVFRAETGQLAQILIQGGVKVTRLGGCWVMSAGEKEKAIRVLVENSKVEKWRGNPVEQIAGPEVGQLPTLLQLMKDRETYLPISPLLRSLGLKVGGKSKNRVGNIFGQDCPVVIFKYRFGDHHSYCFPAEQKEILLQYIQPRLMVIQGES